MAKRPRVVLVTRCFVVRRRDKKLLLIQRSLASGHNGGKWEVPGGKVDEGQTLLDAQKREVKEETNLEVRPILTLVYAHSRVIKDGEYKGLPYVTLFSVTRVTRGRVVISKEHISYKWVSYEEMLTHNLTLEVRKAAIVLKSHLE